MSTLTFTEQVAPNAPSAGKQVIYLKADGLLYKKNAAGVESVVTTPSLPTTGYGYRNVLLNPNFIINQDVKSGSIVLTANAYGHDGWMAGAGGCTYTIATVENIQTVTISAGTLKQIIEGANLQSGSYFLTWSGTAQGRVDSGAYGTTGVIGTAVGGVNQTVEFGVGTLSKMQYEIGVATPFEFRPIPFELFFAQRYYEKTYAMSVAPGSVVTIGGQVVVANLPATVTSTYVYSFQTFKVAKRAPPAVTMWSASGAVNTANSDAPTNFAAGSATGTGPTEAGFAVVNSGGSNMAITYGTVYFNWVANSRLT